MNDFNFNVFDEKYAPTTYLMTPGVHDAIIREAEIKPTRKNLDGIDNSKYLLIKFEVIGGGLDNGKDVVEYLNIYNSNPKAEEIGRKQFQSICVALGITEPKMCRDLINRKLRIEVYHDKQPGKAPRNKVAKYFELVSQDLGAISEKKEEQKPQEKATDEFDDDVPF